jgi:putative transposase
MDWARILAFVTGKVDEELLARIEYLAAENRILKAQLNGRLKLSDAERATLGDIGHRLGRKVLGEVLAASSLCNVAIGWADYCVIIIGKQRKGDLRPMGSFETATRRKNTASNTRSKIQLKKRYRAAP